MDDDDHEVKFFKTVSLQVLTATRRTSFIV